VNAGNAAIPSSLQSAVDADWRGGHVNSPGSAILNIADFLISLLK
jgi:hypothetical protein